MGGLEDGCRVSRRLTGTGDSPEDRWPRAAWAKEGVGALLKEPNRDAIKLTEWALRPCEPLTG